MRSAMHAASQLSGRGPLMWMLPLYLHINQKSDYDDMTVLAIFDLEINLLLQCVSTETRASQWCAIAYFRASAIAYLPAHQNSKCLPPVLIHRAITCDSFKVLAKKA